VTGSFEEVPHASPSSVLHRLRRISMRHEGTMGGELKTVLRAVFDSVDRKDFDAVLAVTDEDAQGVAEISRRWVRGATSREALARGLEARRRHPH
jgi:hypothetical protein